MSSSQTADLLRRLEEQRFIDDARFARAFASDKVRFSAWGKMKIRMALRQKRISSADIDSALEAVEEADYAAAAERASRSARAGLEASAQPRTRRRGFRRPPEILSQNALKRLRIGDCQ